MSRLEFHVRALQLDDLRFEIGVRSAQVGDSPLERHGLPLRLT